MLQDRPGTDLDASHAPGEPGKRFGRLGCYRKVWGAIVRFNCLIDCLSPYVIVEFIVLASVWPV